MIINSPLTNKPAIKVETIQSKFIADKYNSELGIDIQASFNGNKEIELYKCEESGFRFFKPDSIAGDGKFYEILSKSFQNYYEADKWEHVQALQFLKNRFGNKESINVLEIGCAEGEFLTMVGETLPKASLYGIDINQSAIEVAKTRNINAEVSLIENYAPSNLGKFDVVLMFQVLEHIPNIDTFLRSATQVLTAGGILIIAVPNSDSFILKMDRYHTLNLPPHHMGWWNEKSLRSLGSYYPLNCLDVFKEPSDFSHAGEYYRAYLNSKFKGIAKSVYALTRFVVKPFIPALIGKNEGMSIMSFYEKS